MTPMMSKPAQANDTVQQRSAYGNHSDHEPHCNNPIEKQSNHFLDPNLADIISNVVYNIKSNNLVKSIPCSVCTKNVNKNQKAIQCTKCQLWSHATCNGIGKSEYTKLMEEDDQVPWYCIRCLILANTETFPFGLLPKTELCDLLGIDLPSQIDLLPSFETTSKLTNLPN